MADDSQFLTLRVRLQGGAATEAGLIGVAKAEQTVGDKGAFAAEKTFLFGESMYSLRRYGFYAITALGLTAGAVVKLGYDFDKAKAEGVDALTGITHSATVARQEVSALVGLTHDTGLGLSTLVDGAKNMLTFGYSVKQTNEYLKAFGTYAGITGGGSATVSSLVSLFNTIKDTGRLTGRQVKELEGLGVPFSRLASTLGISPLQQTLVERSGLSVNASVAEPAIVSLLGQLTAGQAKPLPMQIGILKSYAGPMMGVLTQPLFNWLTTTALPGLTSRFAAAAKGGATGGMSGMLTGLDPSGTATKAWVTLGNAAKIVWDTFRNLWIVTKPLVGSLLLVSSVVLGLTTHMGAMKLILEPLIALYIIGRTQMVLYGIATNVVKGILAGLTVVQKAVAAATWLFNAALDANPIVLIGLAVVALAAGFYLLYTRVSWFRNGLNDAWNWIRSHWLLLGNILLGPFAPLLDITDAVLSNLKEIKQWGHDVASPFEGLAHDLGIGGGTSPKISSLTSGGKIEIHAHSHVSLDGETVAHSVAKHPLIIGEAAFHGKDDAEARR